MKGTKAIAESLKKEGVKHMFGFPGGSIMPLYDEFMNYEDEFRHVLVRHEQGAAHAADGYAKASGKTGVCFSTSGPGATNLVTGLMSANMDSVPLVAFSGNVPTTLLGKDAFQETDMLGVTMPITKHNFQIRSANDINSTITKAFKIASTGRPGPVFVDLPKDIQVNDVTNENKDVTLQGFKPKIEGHPEQIKKAAKMIMTAERPVILAGGGIIISGASSELTKLAESLNLPVTTTFMGKGCFPEEHPMSLGVIGMHGKKVANYAVSNADLIINFGCRFSDRITGNLKSFASQAKIIHVDIDSAEIGKNVDVDLPVVGDAKNVLQQLNFVVSKMKKRDDTVWSEKMKKLIKECDCLAPVKGNPINPKLLMYELNRILEDDDILATGTGQHQMFAAHFIKRNKPRTSITSGGSGTMGFGFPAAIGAKVAKPDSEVVDLDGDGSFAMVVQELATCKEENIKTIPIIMNNGYLGMVRQWQELFFDKRYASTHLKRNPDFAKLANAYGLEGITVERDSELKEALERAFKNDSTTVLDVMVEEESNILPMFAAGANNTDMFGGCIQKKGVFF